MANFFSCAKIVRVHVRVPEGQGPRAHQHDQRQHDEPVQEQAWKQGFDSTKYLERKRVKNHQAVYFYITLPLPPPFTSP